MIRASCCRVEPIPKTFIEKMARCEQCDVYRLNRASRAIGLLQADNQFSGRPIPVESFGALRIFANAAGLAIENALLYQETQRRANELASLQEVGLALTASLEPQNVYDQITEQATRLLDCQVGNMFLWDEVQEAALGVSSYGVAGPGVRGRLAPLEDSGVLVDLITHRRPVAIEAGQTDPRVFPHWREAFNIQAVLCLPLLAREKLHGFLFLIDQQKPRQWQPAEIALAVSLASQAAIAVENARLYEHERQLAYHLRSLNQAVTRIGASLNLDTVVQMVAEALVEQCDAAFARIWVTDETGDALILKASAGLYTRLDGSRARPARSHEPPGVRSSHCHNRYRRLQPKAAPSRQRYTPRDRPSRPWS